MVLLYSALELTLLITLSVYQITSKKSNLTHFYKYLIPFVDAFRTLNWVNIEKELDPYPSPSFSKLYLYFLL